MATSLRTRRRRIHAAPGAAFEACSESPPPVVFHGTTSDFEAFSDDRLGVTSGHPAAALGHYFSTCPMIASSFTLKPVILDRAHEVLAGSKVLFDLAWPMSQLAHCADGCPYDAGARVMLASLSITTPARISAVDFAQLIDAEYDIFDWQHLREALIDAGYDSLLIEGDPAALAAREIVAEHAPDTWVPFHASSIQPLSKPAWERLAECSSDGLARPESRHAIGGLSL